MKKFIFGCVLLLAGVIGFSVWISGGAYSEDLFYYFSLTDWVITLFFIGMSVIGFRISYNEIKKDR